MKPIVTGLLVTLSILLVSATAAQAQSNPAVGLWKMTEPDRTILVRMSDENGMLVGRVEKKTLKNGTDDTSGVCTKCPDDQKDKPLKGLRMIWGMQREGTSNKWKDGKILEPDSGKVYSCRIESTPDGKQLKVRGSILFISKTMTWDRVE